MGDLQEDTMRDLSSIRVSPESKIELTNDHIRSVLLASRAISAGFEYGFDIDLLRNPWNRDFVKKYFYNGGLEDPYVWFEADERDEILNRIKWSCGVIKKYIANEVEEQYVGINQNYIDIQLLESEFDKPDFIEQIDLYIDSETKSRIFETMSALESNLGLDLDL